MNDFINEQQQEQKLNDFNERVKFDAQLAIERAAVKPAHYQSVNREWGQGIETAARLFMRLMVLIEVKKIWWEDPEDNEEVFFASGNAITPDILMPMLHYDMDVFEYIVDAEIDGKIEHFAIVIVPENGVEAISDWTVRLEEVNPVVRKIMYNMYD